MINPIQLNKMLSEKKTTLQWTSRDRAKAFYHHSITCLCQCETLPIESPREQRKEVWISLYLWQILPHLVLFLNPFPYAFCFLCPLGPYTSARWKLLAQSSEGAHSTYFLHNLQQWASSTLKELLSHSKNFNSFIHPAIAQWNQVSWNKHIEHDSIRVFFQNEKCKKVRDIFRWQRKEG